ncbi:MAG TPA: hypothetical protein VGN72_07850 [Tepidisphaeraceae bacterium]|jgi:hypothetical protein|nr:hypothetical protein [Tepidisphaeraceae bacterium]
MAERLSFSRDGASRVVSATQHYERHPDYQATRQQPPRRNTSNDEFWIQLTAEGTSALVGWYSWKLVYFNPVTNAWADVSPAVTGTTNAREQNLTTGLYSASAPKRYRARMNGYNGSGAPVYVFFGGGASTPLAAHNQGVVVAAAPTFINAINGITFAVNGTGVDLDNGIPAGTGLGKVLTLITEDGSVKDWEYPRSIP